MWFAILHIPHASRVVPPEVRRSFALSDVELEDELTRMTDSFTHELFGVEHKLARKIIFPVSRLVVDPERFVSDADEPMAATGMGVVYTKTSNGHDLRKHLSNPERTSLVAKYYKPHHEKLTTAVRDALAEYGRCLIIDCHSFASSPLPHEPDQSRNRPDICIGTDEFHTPAWLSALAAKLFRERGLRVELDRPFSGTLVPKAYYAKNRTVWSVMIETNRSLYMDEVSGQRHQGFGPLRGGLLAVVESLVNQARGV